MRGVLLMSLALWLSTGVQASEVSKIMIPAKNAARLKLINQWLTENVNTEDCPGRTYFGLVTGVENQQLVGYEVIAECPDAPTPSVPLYFDPQQKYLEKNQGY
ncbi:MAG: hypothetical protein HY074_06295 [Deltaproteobacteria bacterium]|nr:hypothetical protein [Deltaproteobacteria bacterium]